MRIYALCIIALFAAGTAAAQNMPATQLFSTPLIINPAMTGLMATDIRFTENFYSASDNGLRYSQFCASIDMSILKNALPIGDAMGFGMTYSNSYYSTSSAMNAKGISTAYHKGFGKYKRQHISLGVEGVFNRLSYYDYYIGYSDKKFVSNVALNTGIQYSGILSEKVSVFGGYALKNVIVADNDRRLGMFSRPPVHLINAGGSVKISPRVQLFANTYYAFSNPGTDLTFGSYARVLLNTPDEKTKKRDIALYLGSWISKYDIISPYLGLQIGRSRAGFNYNRSIDRSYLSNSWDLSFVFTTNHRKHTTTPIPVATDAATPAIAPSSRWQCPTMF